MSPAELASKIDHTLLKPEALLPDVDRVIDEGLTHRFASICISPPFVAHTAKRLKGSGVKTCTVIGFPNGTHTPVVKGIEATTTIKQGAEEIDVVAHLPLLLNLDLDGARGELIEVVKAARATRSGRSLQEFLRSELIALADRPSPDDLLARVRARKLHAGADLTAADIVEAVHADRP